LIEYLPYLAVFVAGVAVWLPIYYYMVSRWVGDHVVRRVENKEIDLNYLLDQGGIFDELADRTVTLFKHHMLAEMGQLSRAADHTENISDDPAAMGIQAAGELLKMVGMKKPPAILQYKVANALGQMATQDPGTADLSDFGENPYFKQ
jgi:hypothetical protein